MEIKENLNCRLSEALPLRTEMFDECPWSWARREAGTGLICGYREYEAMACQWLQQLFVNWNTVSLWKDLLIHSKTADILRWTYRFYFPIMHRFMAQYITCCQMKSFWKKEIHSVVLNSVTWHLIRLLEVRVMNWRKTWWDVTRCSKVSYSEKYASVSKLKRYKGMNPNNQQLSGIPHCEGEMQEKKKPFLLSWVIAYWAYSFE